METTMLLSATAMLFGAVIGSFLNVVILRLPEESQSIIFPASHCPHCKSSLSWYENIPILSYLALRGKCRYCKVKISFQYPLVELFTALLFAAVIHSFGLTLTALGYLIFCCSLITIIWIDIYHQIIPDCISLPGIILGFLFSFVNSSVHWQESLIGLLLGGGILYAVALFYYLVRKQEGMGGGDIKLLAMLGAFLGWKSIPFIIFSSSLAGSLFGIILLIKNRTGGSTRFPFGPFLAVSGLVFLLFKKDIISLFILYLQVTSGGM